MKDMKTPQRVRMENGSAQHTRVQYSQKSLESFMVEKDTDDLQQGNGEKKKNWQHPVSPRAKYQLRSLDAASCGSVRR